MLNYEIIITVNDMKILCLGHISYDITFPVSKFITENKKIRVNSRIECGGGPASNAAYLLGKWGSEVYIAGLVGNDYYGKKIIDEFKDANVNTKYIEMREGYKTSNSIIINNISNSSRTVLSYRETDETMNKLELDFEPDIILIDGHEVLESNRLLEKYPNAISVIDAGRATEDVIKLAEKVNYVVCSREFAEEVSGIKIDYNVESTIINLYHELERRFHGIIVVTLESKGALYKYDGNIGIMDALKVNAVDSTGAGDLFHGAFVYGVSKQYDLNTILTIATVAGGISVKRIGGRNSVATKEEMRMYIHDFE